MYDVIANISRTFVVRWRNYFFSKYKEVLIRVDFVDFRALVLVGTDCTVQDPGLASTSKRLGQIAIFTAATPHQTTSTAGPWKPLCSSIKES